MWIVKRKIENKRNLLKKKKKKLAYEIGLFDIHQTVH